jgi:flagellar motility protein MotE (MotC chaperone)
MSRIVHCAVLSAFCLFGCDNQGADAQARANEAQAKADQKIAEANAEAREEANEAQAEADEKVADVQASFSKTAENYRHDMQGKLDDLDKDIAELDAKAKTATGKAKAELEAQLPSIHARRDAFARSLKSLESTPATAWDVTRTQVDKEWDELKLAVDRVD